MPSVMLVTQTTPGPRWEGTNTGAQARRWLPRSSACGPLQWPPSLHCSPNHLASLISLFPWLTVTPQRQVRACRSFSSTFQCLPWPKRQSPIDEWPLVVSGLSSHHSLHLPFATFGSALPRDPHSFSRSPSGVLSKVSIRKTSPGILPPCFTGMGIHSPRPRTQ